MPRQVVNVDTERARELLSHGAVLLDVREKDERAAGHPPGATHAPLSTLRPAEQTAGGTVLVICRFGARSAKATQMLLDAGVDARDVSGGMRAWVADGQRIVTSAGRPGTVT